MPINHPSINPHRLASSGFTLLEVVIVLLVISILTISFIGPLTNYIYQRQVTETQKSLEEIKEALLGFVAANGRLPRPAKSALDGKEIDNCDDAPCYGFVPWETLGTPRLDAWGKIFQYTVAREFSKNSPDLIKFTTSTANTKIIFTRLPGAINATTRLASEIPVIVWSFGRRNFGTNAAGNMLHNQAIDNIDEIKNAELLSSGNANPIVRDFAETSATGGEFDDQFVWISTQILFARILNAGKSLN